MANWLDKYEQGGMVLKQKTKDNYGKKPNPNDVKISMSPNYIGSGYNIQGRNYSPAWGGMFQDGGSVYPVNYVPQAQMGGSIPGAVGFSYARTQSPAPSNGPYAKKTKASAQNGEEMRYYQNGLDWKPKSISQNGSWLDEYDVAQTGEELKELPSVRSLINDTMNRKIQSKGKGKEVKTVEKDNTKTSKLKEIKKLSGKQQNELAQRLSEEQAAKDWVQNSMEEAYKSPLMSPGYFTPEGMAIGAMQGATKLGPDLYEGDYKGAAMDALMVLPEAGNIAKALGPSEGLLSNAYKYNPWAFKPNPEAYYRGIGKEGMDDILNSGIIRSKKQNAYPEPYFSKGKIGDAYAKGYFAELTNEPMKGVGSFSTGDLIQTPMSKVSINNPNLKLYQKDWLRGYKPVEVPNNPTPIRNLFIQPESKFSKGELSPEMEPYLSRVGESFSEYIPYREDDYIKWFNEQKAKMNPSTPIQDPRSMLRGSSIIDINDLPNNNFELFDLNNVRKPSGSIGNQGATSEGARDILKSIGIEVESVKPGQPTFKEMVEHLKNNPNDAAKYQKFLEKEPINISELPDGSYQINDGHHRATLSYYSGNENIPTIIKNKGEYIKQRDGGIIKDDLGQWAHPGEITEIGSNDITMEGVPYDVLGISDTGDTKLMKPGKKYKFKGKKVTEFPMAKNGLRQEQKGLVNLDNLTNFTNYNTKQPGGWLDQY
jgi:hypothetical protein